VAPPADVLDDAFTVYLAWGPELEHPASARLHGRRPEMSAEDVAEALAFCRRALEEALPLGDEYAARRLDYKQLRAALCDRYPTLSPVVMDKLANRVCYDAVI
jgi:hypothetical protein